METPPQHSKRRIATMRRAARKEGANPMKRGNRELRRTRRAASAGKDAKPVGSQRAIRR